MSDISRLTAAPSPALRASLADRYRIERELGQGGMATVYLAHDPKHHRRVALKAGEPETAVDAYRQYLTLRHDPEPALIPQRDSVRAEHAELVGER